MSERNGSAESAPRSVTANTAELLGDVVTLAELQGKLFLADAADGWRKLWVPLATLCAGGALLLAALPVALVAAALALVETTPLSPAQAFAVTAVVALLVGAVICVAACRNIRFGWGTFERSWNEWNQNARWFKRVMSQAGRSANRRDQQYPVSH